MSRYTPAMAIASRCPRSAFPNRFGGWSEGFLTVNRELQVAIQMIFELPYAFQVLPQQIEKWRRINFSNSASTRSSILTNSQRQQAGSALFLFSRKRLGRPVTFCGLSRRPPARKCRWFLGTRRIAVAFSFGAYSLESQSKIKLPGIPSNRCGRSKVGTLRKNYY